MTASVATKHRPALFNAQAPSRRRRIPSIHTGQLVCTQIAILQLVAGALYGTVTSAVAAFLFVVALAVIWLRLRGRWAYEWLGVAARFTSRRRQTTDGPAAVLRFALPGARIDQIDLAGEPAAVITDGRGLAAVLELGDPAGLLAEEQYALPPPATLLPPPSMDHPPTRIQLLLTAVPAISGGHGKPATSYRQLTDGRVAAQVRALLVVRVESAEGWTTAELARSLSGLIRKIRRRLDDVPARPLGAEAAARAINDLAHDDGSPAAEGWSGLRIGNLLQATYQVRQHPGVRTEPTYHLLTRLLALPAAATTVSVTAAHPVPEAGRRQNRRDESVSELTSSLQATIRLAAPDPTELNSAGQTLHQWLSAQGVEVTRLDGEHLDGLAATLPLGVGTRGGTATTGADGMAGVELILGASGLVVGANRDGDPVVARLFRSEHTRVLLIGGVSGTQLLTFRAMALGAQVIVQTSRPQVWERFVRGGMAPGDSITVVPPGRVVSSVPAPNSALRPLLRVVDVGAVGTGPIAAAAMEAGVEGAGALRVTDVHTDVARARATRTEATRAGATRAGANRAGPNRAGAAGARAATAGTAGAGAAGLRPLGTPAAGVDTRAMGGDVHDGPGWQATLVVRDDFGPADIDVAARADLLVVQRLRDDEAELLGAAVGLGETAQWLTKIRPDMIGLINRRAVRWAAWAQTPIEEHLIGPPTRA